MLKAIVTSFGPGAVGVTFESQSYGRTNRDLPTFYLPCASRAHAVTVANAYNGVAFTETRETPERKVAKEVARAIASLPGAAVGAAEFVAADMAELERYRGAPMGIADFTAPDVTPLDALHFGIARIALDEGGYAPDGVYWGLPRNTLWHACATCRGTDHTANGVLAARWFRAPSYAHAVNIVREEFSRAVTQRVAS